MTVSTSGSHNTKEIADYLHLVGTRRVDEDDGPQYQTTRVVVQH